MSETLSLENAISDTYNICTIKVAKSKIQIHIINIYVCYPRVHFVRSLTYYYILLLLETISYSVHK